MTAPAMRSLVAGLGLAVTLLVSTACGSSADTIDVYGASSLTELLRELGEAFEREDGEANVRFSFASSSALATQIRQGAPADVYISANPTLTGALAEEGYVEASQLIASTRMVIVARSDDDTVATLSHLGDANVILVLAGEGVPAGDYARDVLSNASIADGLGDGFRERVLANVRSFEPNVRAALLKVELGEADAAIVYDTDVDPRNSRLRTVAVPDEYNVVATFAAALLIDADGGARAFYDFLASEAAAEIIRSFGFDSLRYAD